MDRFTFDLARWRCFRALLEIQDETHDVSLREASVALRVSTDTASFKLWPNARRTCLEEVSVLRVSAFGEDVLVSNLCPIMRRQVGKSYRGVVSSINLDSLRIDYMMGELQGTGDVRFLFFLPR